MKNLRNKLDYVDAMRGLAILLVILLHVTIVSPITTFSPLLTKIIDDSPRGVQLFYIVSAFTLFYSLSMRTPDEKHAYRNFFLRRFFRIAPMWYTALAIFLILDYSLGVNTWLGDSSKAGIHNIMTHIFFIHGFYPYYINSIVPGGWSVAVEMIFYLFVPLLFKVITTLNRAVMFFVAVFVSSNLLNSYLTQHVLISSKSVWSDYLFFYLPNQLPVFFIGFILFFLIIKHEYKISQLNMLVIIFFLFYFFYFNFGYIYQVAALFLLLIVFLSKNKSLLLVNPVTRFLGKISYSMYLLQFLIIYVLEKNHIFNNIHSERVRFAVSYLFIVCGTALFSFVTYQLIEKNGMRLGTFIIKRLEAGRADFIRHISRVNAARER
jgi:peptidoglycan/LPS O-acetylase OafA/YrhL